MDETLRRILEEMQRENVSETEMQEVMGVPKGAFSNWKREKGHSYFRYLDLAADRLGVSIDYLVRGHETTYAPVSTEEKELISNFRKLTTEEKDVIKVIAKMFGEKNT